MTRRARKGGTARSSGSFLLAATGKTQVQIGVDVGVTKVTVHQWISGDKKPGPSKRPMLRDLYGIPEDSWEKPHKPKAPAKGATTKAADEENDADITAAGGAFAMARSLQREAQNQLDELKNEGNTWTAAERARVVQGLASTVNVLAKLTGQYELGRRMLELPIWKALEREMFLALKDFPDAAEAVAQRLETFERQWLTATG